MKYNKLVEKMEIKEYPDGTSYVTVSEKENLYITFKVNSYKGLWHLNQFVDAYVHKHKCRPTITIPNLIDAQADRRFADNQSAGLKLVLKFLGQMEADFRVFHPHNAEVVEMTTDNIEIISNRRFVESALHKLSDVARGFTEWGEDLSKNTIILAPDAGAYKSTMKLAEELDWQGEVLSASKSRDPKTGKLTQVLPNYNFEGKNVVLLDDIVVYGGTARNLARKLREAGVNKLALVVSHMTIRDLQGKSPTHEFDHVFTTNSKFDKYYEDYGIVPDICPINIIPIEDVL